MTERFTSDLGFILIALIVAALLGFIIGYLIQKIKRDKYLAIQNENEQLKKKLEACRKELEKQNIVFDANAAREAFNEKIKENDLKIIEGIGEKIEEILQNRGITTWHKLSQTPAEEIKKILLEDGGSKYSMHEPKTWPKQALLAYEGKWKELKTYQDKLNAGK